VEFLAFFFAAHIDFNTEITDNETVFIISGNYDNFFNSLTDLAKEIGAEYRVTDSNYLIITVKSTYEIDKMFRTLGY
jgi:hypothetical protein